MTKQEMATIKVSLIVSTYNRPDALAVCLRSVFRQSRLPDEIIVGDDGSRPETKQLIDELSSQSPVQIIHVWHEDNGYRLAMMRNKSVAASSGEYIIEIDGDIILHPEFVKDHLRLAMPSCYVKGGRANLGRSLTQRICRSGQPPSLNWWTHGIESKPENAIYCPALARLIAPYYRRHRSSALGCNMSFFKSDFLKVNGYDEYYEGWGGEDGDFGSRLQLLGLRKMHLKFAGIAYHLWHEDKYMHNAEHNIAYSKRKKSARCANGVDKYL